ncbi:hypothetical protein [Falsiroseomonas selenitidurans]|uniref:Uncharacterized protein n=1 Tax=Falsiroseomonas selenitidurans TaxID=2716335 RepID=A0ABX1E9U9_9PROT|nr:hypothetical protein [Falsiroseomonas selenitidurans]NKC33570.1 hypothetical protein [Falsiroseomonas selenitidurans]
MSITEGSPLRAAMRLRDDGDLPAAAELLRLRADPGDAQAGMVLLRYLFELQDYATLQDVTRDRLARLDAGFASRAGAPYLATLLRFAERCCLPLADIAPALQATATAARAAPELMLAWRAVTHRQRHRARLAAQFEGGVSLISLGLNCLAWHLPGRWGLRRETDFTALFGPFALAGHTIPGVLAALEDDFATYCTPETTRLVTTQRGHELAMRRDRTAHWNHNRGAFWLRDGAAPLRQSIIDKAVLFRAACRRPDAVFVLATCPVEYPEEALDFLPRLDAALARYTGRTGNRILISNQTARRREKGIVAVDATTRYVTCPYPAADYVWHDDLAADSREGLLFERAYMGFLLRALLQWRLLRRRADAPPDEVAPDAAAADEAAA